MNMENKKILTAMGLLFLICLACLFGIYKLILEQKIAENKEKLENTIWIKHPNGSITKHNQSDFTQTELSAMSNRGYMIAKWNIE